MRVSERIPNRAREVKRRNLPQWEATVDAVIERMGLRVIKNTLEPDWDSEAILQDINGSIEILILPSCMLEAEVIEIVAPLLATEACEDRMDGSIVVEFWKFQRQGDRITMTPSEYANRNARAAKPSPYFNEHAGDVRPSEGWGGGR